MRVRSGVFLLIFLHGAISQEEYPTTNKSTSYDESLAIKLLHLSAAAYGPKQKECIEVTFPIEEERFLFTSTEAVCDILDSSCALFIVSSKNRSETIITFRGTKSTGQLLMEGWDTVGIGLDFYGMGKVNRYFMKALDRLWSSVIEFLARYEYRDHSIIFTGHSLGGALAALAAARTVKQGFRPVSAIRLYTFGQPRTGSYEFAMNFDSLKIESFRVVYASDIVPHQPFCKKNMQMPTNKEGSRACRASKDNEAYHHGTEIWYPQSMKAGSLYLECVGEPHNEDMECSDMISFDVLAFKENATDEITTNMDAYIWDHKHYFDVMVSGFGISGCSDRLIGAEPAQQSRISKVISDVLGVLGKLG